MTARKLREISHDALGDVGGGNAVWDLVNSLVLKPHLEATGVVTGRLVRLALKPL